MSDSQSRDHRFESPSLPFQNLVIFVSPRHVSPLSCINEYLVIDSGGNVSEQSLHLIAVWLECFQEKSSWYRNEQVCQGVKCKGL